MTQLKYTGGARIGMSNATWPFATLTVTQEKLELNATILGNFTFFNSDIISIEPYSAFMSSGLKINHNVPTYKEKIIFWTFQNPGSIINEIENIGFFDLDKPSVSQNDRELIIEKQKQGGFPVKVPFAIAVIVIWNVLMLFDFVNFYKSDSKGVPIGNGVLCALGFVLGTSILTLISKEFRKLILKEGRELQDISKFLYFIIFISGMMLINFLTFHK
jgi:hypothetical protein